MQTTPEDLQVGNDSPRSLVPKAAVLWRAVREELTNPLSLVHENLTFSSFSILSPWKPEKDELSSQGAFLLVASSWHRLPRERRLVSPDVLPDTPMEWLQQALALMGPEASKPGQPPHPVKDSLVSAVLSCHLGNQSRQVLGGSVEAARTSPMGHRR